ncbi:MAG: ligand-binding sensor domain-containing protein [Spirochaetota bacterium]
MNYRRFYAALMLGFVIWAGEADAQGHIYFEHIDKSTGLSNMAVSSIVQDSQGFLWFGTQGGLNRYDGYEFRTYKKKPFDSNSLSHDLIQTLYMDADDILWIGTYNGLNRFDLKTGIITRYEHIRGEAASLSNDVVVAIQRDGKGQLWVGTLNGLNLLNEEEGTFTHYYHDPEDPGSISHNTIRSIVQDSQGRMWFGSYGGLNLYNPVTDTFSSYQHSEEDPESIGSNNVMAITQTEPGKLWLGTWGGGGLTEFDIATGKSTNFKLPDNRSYVLNAQKKGVIYVGTWGGGLIEFIPETGEHQQYSSESYDASSIGHNIVYSLYYDESGVLWIGTNGGGIDKMKKPDNEFTYWQHNPDDPSSLSQGKVTAVLRDSKGVLWAGTYNGGLNRYDARQKRMIHYFHDADDPQSLVNDIITSIFEDSRGNIWVCTNGGLNRYNPEQDNFERWFGPEHQTPLKDQIVYGVLEDIDGSLWIGTYSGGVARYSPATGEMRYFQNDPDNPNSLSDNLVYDMLVDSSGTFWVATNNGLNRFDRDRAEFVSYYHDEDDSSTLTSNTVRELYEDSEGRLWLGTVSGGLNLYHPDSESFTHFMQEEGLPSNTVYALLEDNRGRLWISTMDQLAVFDYELMQFRVVDEDNGIWAEEFSRGHYGGESGEELFFGTTEGLYMLQPGEFERNTHVPPVQLTSFRVFDREVDFGHSLQLVEEIEVEYQDEFIAFEFAALDYVNPKKNKYAYKLEGFDEQWIYPTTRRYASYTNLPPGDYTFRVKASNSDAIWNEEGLSIDLRVIPPIWRTNAAFMLYALLGIFMIYLILVLINREQRRKFEIKTQELERQRLEQLETEIHERRRVESQLIQAKEEAENANRIKSDFIANISHEIRTPMNAIIGYTQLIRRASEDSTIHGYLDTIKRSGTQLLALINDLLDLSAMEIGMLKINKTNMNLEELLRDIESMYGYRANEKGLDFAVGIEPGTPLEIYADAHRLRQILYNLVGNALKFTESGKVALKIEGSKHEENCADLRILVSDSGIGIHPEEQERIFDAFTQQRGQEERFGGTGLGLTITRRLAEAMDGLIEVHSSLGKGSVFIVYFPHIKLAGGEIAGTHEHTARQEEHLASALPADFGRFDFDSPVEKKSELLDWLRGPGTERWEHISGTLFMDDIRDFSRLLQRRAELHQADVLKNYGQTLESHVTSLNLSALKRLLYHFPALIEGLQQAPER